MLLGARQFFERRDGGGWQNPYVTDGLVAMWDGEWNAGGGVHDASATTWVDLSANGLDIPLISGSFGSNCLSVNGIAGVIGQITSDILTIEYVGVSLRSSSAQGVAQIQKMTGSSDSLRHVAYRANNTFNFASNGPCFPIIPTERFYGSQVFSSATDIGGAMYKNGVSIQSQGGGAYFNLSSTNLIIGTCGNYAFYGEINRIALYSRALTAAEIAANYAIDKARFNLP